MTDPFQRSANRKEDVIWESPLELAMDGCGGRLTMENGTAKRVGITAIAGTIFLGLITVNAEYLAKQIGADAWGYNALRWLGREMGNPAAALVLIVLAGLAAGASIFAWSDYIWRGWRARWQLSDRLSLKSSDRKLVAMSLMLIFGSCFVLSALWLAGEHYLVVSSGSSIISEEKATLSQKQLHDVTQQLEAALSDAASLRRQLEETQRAQQPTTAAQQPQASFATTYTISQPDIRKIRDEIFKVREALPAHLSIQTADDTMARGVATGLSKGVGFGGINMDGMSIGYPITPQETGISIRVGDLEKIPDDAKRFADAIKKALGIEPRYTAMQGIGVEGFRIFVGTNPNEN